MAKKKRDSSRISVSQFSPRYYGERELENQSFHRSEAASSGGDEVISGEDGINSYRLLRGRYYSYLNSKIAYWENN